MKHSLVILFFLSLASTCFSQNVINSTRRKGEFYFYWGWNRSWYGNSDINFKGEDYNFTLSDVKANDRQTPFSFNKYLNPTNITIPQYNFRIGYFIKDHYSISIGADHMKYVVTPNQTVSIHGSIVQTGTIYDGNYNNDLIVLEENFLQFEHTDGLNYINIDFRRHDLLIALSNKIKMNVSEGIGAGMLIPRTNTTLLNKDRYDEFHLSGYGINLLVGLNVTFFDALFIQSELKGGYINMPDIRTTQFIEDKASQSFFFAQLNLTFGIIVDVKK
jgi:hypothetical protein